MSLLADAPSVGVQQPRLHVSPPRVSTAGREASTLAAACGLRLDDWQQLVLDEMCGERADGGWSSFEVGLVVPRQNGKGSVLEARELAGLFLFGEELILHSAHEHKTAIEAYRRIKGLIENTPDLDKLVYHYYGNNANTSIELKDGRRIRFVARSAGSGRGFTGDLVVLDEAYKLGPREMGALLPTLSARPNPQIIYASSAPWSDSHQLHAVRARALDQLRTGEQSRLCYLEWSVDGDLIDVRDPELWGQANPALGIRISDQFIASEVNAMPESMFLRERLGVPDAPVLDSDGVFGPSAWLEVKDAQSRIDGNQVAVGVDMNPDRSFVSLAVAGVRADGLGHIELVVREPRADTLIESLVRLSESVQLISPVMVDVASPAASLTRLMESNGLKVKELDTRSVSRACGVMFDAVTNNEVRHRGQPLLDSAVFGAARSFQADTWRWSRRRGDGDISPLVAATLALWGLDTADNYHDPTLDVW